MLLTLSQPLVPTLFKLVNRVNRSPGQLFGTALNWSLLAQRPTEQNNEKTLAIAATIDGGSQAVVTCFSLYPTVSLLFIIELNQHLSFENWRSKQKPSQMWF